MPTRNTLVLRRKPAARVRSFKWVESSCGSGLFDLLIYPAERNHLSSRKPDVLAHINSRFAAWAECMEKAEPRGPFRDFQTILCNGSPLFLTLSPGGIIIFFADDSYSKEVRQ